MVVRGLQCFPGLSPGPGKFGQHASYEEENHPPHQVRGEGCFYARDHV